ncbi:MAG: hypothetical protein QOD42_1277 [Sphingomonadales bacterium]|jgi:hypothetical protein|nr:hypothetical protein [Sphingomonadales bacterium]
MATIESVHLELKEQLGAAAALVTYTMRGSLQDVQQQTRYAELVQLVGDDVGPGEDGQNELIPNGELSFAESLAFASSAPVTRVRLLALPSKSVDEDPSGPFHTPQEEDEIRARVTLTRILSTVVAQSNLVRRGGVIPGNSDPTPV